MKRLTVLIAGLLLATAAHPETRSYEQRQEFIASVADEARRGRFSSLDRLANTARLNKARFSDGKWRLGALLDGLEIAFSEAAKDGREWQKLEGTLLQFAQSRPDSTNAWIFYTTALETRAWVSRGPGLSNQVTVEGWRSFRQNIAQARKVLDSKKSRLTVNPEWYAQRIRLALYSGEEKSRIHALFEEAIAREPLYYGTYYAALLSHTPKWGGSIESLIAFIRTAAVMSGQGEGTSLLARLLWVADQEGYEVSGSSTLDWKLVEQSFMDTLRFFPDDWNSQAFLLLTCGRSNRATAARLLPYIKEEPSAALFGPNLPAYRGCLKWAKGEEPMIILRDPATGKEKLVK